MNVNFIIPDSEKYIKNSNFDGDMEKNWNFFNNGQRAWIVQTYTRLSSLKCDKINVSFSKYLEKDSINVIFTDDYNAIKNKHKYYCIVIILDRKVYFPGNNNVVQNFKSNPIIRTEYKPHWSQAGLIERIYPNEGYFHRGPIKIGFFGIPKNTIDIDKILSDYLSDNVLVEYMGPDKWNDYSNIDIAIAIRSFSSNCYDHKPPTKLFNAWKARVLFIGGNDSSYSQVGQAREDYIKIESESELNLALRDILNHPERICEMVDNGSLKYKENYSNDHISKNWIDFLSNEKKAFLKWKNYKPYQRKIFTIYCKLIYVFLKVNRRVKVIFKAYE